MEAGETEDADAPTKQWADNSKLEEGRKCAAAAALAALEWAGPGRRAKGRAKLVRQKRGSRRWPGGPAQRSPGPVWAGRRPRPLAFKWAPGCLAVARRHTHTCDTYTLAAAAPAKWNKPSNNQSIRSFDRAAFRFKFSHCADCFFFVLVLEISGRPIRVQHPAPFKVLSYRYCAKSINPKGSLRMEETMSPSLRTRSPSSESKISEIQKMTRRRLV